jgi:hypothetical protein
MKLSCVLSSRKSRLKLGFASDLCKIFGCSQQPAQESASKPIVPILERPIWGRKLSHDRL